jgi:hypothetical protein
MMMRNPNDGSTTLIKLETNATRRLHRQSSGGSDNWEIIKIPVPGGEEDIICDKNKIVDALTVEEIFGINDEKTYTPLAKRLRLDDDGDSAGSSAGSAHNPKSLESATDVSAAGSIAEGPRPTHII